MKPLLESNVLFISLGLDSKKKDALSGRLYNKIPAITYSRELVCTTIGPVCVTAVFGMGTGVAPQVVSPEIFIGSGQDPSKRA